MGRSREGAWIEIFAKRSALPNANGRSREGAWIEMVMFDEYMQATYCRSREGAWIEMSAFGLEPMPLTSLPRGSVD